MSAVEIRHSVKEVKHRSTHSAEEEGIKTSQKKRFLRWVLIDICLWFMDRLEFVRGVKRASQAQHVKTLRHKMSGIQEAVNSLIEVVWRVAEWVTAGY